MTTISRSHHYSLNTGTKSESNPYTQKFLSWCENQESYRFPILATIVAVQGCFIIPVTLLLALQYNIGLTDITFLTVSITTTAVMVSNMALSPMKVVISIFVINLLINLTLIAVHIPSLFN